LIKRRYVDEKSNHIFLRVDIGDVTPTFTPDDAFLKMVNIADCMIISDYNKGFLTDESFEEIFENKPSKQIVILDTKRPLSLSILDSVDFVKLNEHEYDNNCKILGLPFMSYYRSKLIITKGGNGTIHNGKEYTVEAKQTIDVSGAGDTFVAAFAYMYMQCFDTEKSIIFANKMASIVVTKRGVSTV
jgi:D-beta-D-heptose 7-phosphate kinase/D-beta-D-heptose 1-phosphate adenosyltransferase